MMLNGALGALVAITAASGFVAPWAAIVIGIGAGSIAVFGVIFVESIGIDDPIGAVAVHGMSGVWGTLATGLFAVPVLAKNLATGTGGLVYTGSFHQLGVQALGVATVGVFAFTTSFGALFVMHKLWGIRVEDHVETAGLDVSEHGMWGYPEFYIPVPGGYGTESHGHLGASRAPADPRSPDAGGRDVTAIRRRLPGAAGSSSWGHGRLEAAQETDVVPVDEDVEEARHAVAFEDSRFQRGEPGDERVERLTHGAGLDVDEALSAGFRAQHGWNADLGHCFKRYSKGGSLP